MSKVMLSLPEGMTKDCVVGAFVSLGCYVIMQFLVALLISEEVVGGETLYPAVCISAGIASFAGCLCGVARTKTGSALSAATVVVVFLALTVMIGFCFGELNVIDNGLVGVGVSMSVGGLVAAVFCSANGKKAGARREKRKGRHSKR